MIDLDHGHKVTVFLEEVQIPYRIIPVNIGAGEQFNPEFLAIAPNNRIPAIVDTEPTNLWVGLLAYVFGVTLMFAIWARKHRFFAM